MCSQLPNQVLKSISIIDSPGILSGEKQRISRGQCPCPPRPTQCWPEALSAVGRGFPSLVYSPHAPGPPASLSSPRSRAEGTPRNNQGVWLTNHKQTANDSRGRGASQLLSLPPPLAHIPPNCPLGILALSKRFLVCTWCQTLSCALGVRKAGGVSALKELMFC